MKVCTRCERSLDESLFWREAKTPTGLKAQCKTCMQAERNKRLVFAPAVEHKECSACFELKPAAEFRRAANRRDGIRAECKECEADPGGRRGPIPRYDFGVLAALMGFGWEAHGSRHPELSDAELGVRLGVSVVLVQSARRRGLSWAQADEWAIRAGLHPEVVWPGWLDRLTA